ncbi:MAG: CHAT domain-containing protein [Acidobacteriia bacterium]|nr:CHAT domain-containing protein [Terriglobia bacterium]
MSQQSNHLADIEIKEYLRSRPGDRPDARDALIDTHLSECGTCLSRTLQLQRAQLGLEQTRVARARHKDCPSNQTIANLAAGLVPAELVAATIHHAAHCDFCGPLLQSYLEEFSEEMPQEAAAFLAQRSTATAAWREKFVAENIPGREPLNIADWLKKVAGSMVPKLPAPRWAAGAVAALLLVVATTGVTTLIVSGVKPSPTKAKALALAANPEQKTLEMRIPGAPYAPYEIKMGPGSEPKRSLSLVKAEEILLTQKSAGRMDAQWLEVEGLTTLLEGTGSGAARAASDFERARAEGRDDPSLEIELAISYYASDHPNLPKTIDLLEGVLKRPRLPDEDRKAALYDLAVAYENINAWELAVARWNEYLKADSSSEWAKNARTRLERAKSKAPKQQSRSPAEFPDDGLLQAQVEQYQDVAIRYWLPIAVNDPQSKAALYTRKLADLLAEQHSDPWLRDFLNAIHPDQADAVKALAEAFAKNKQGLYGAAAARAEHAAGLFAKHHNLAGELRARYEDIYANQREVEARECVARSGVLQKQLALTAYRSLQGQVALVRATCLNLKEDFEASKNELNASQEIAGKFRFPVLRLRVMGISAGIERLQHRDEESWRRGVDGLRLYGEGEYPADRLYQLCIVLEQYAEKKHLLYAQQALLEQAIGIQEAYPPEDEGVILKGTLYGRLSAVSVNLGQDDLARTATRKANLFLGRAPNEPSADKYVLFVKIGLAQTQLKMGDPQGAVDTLEPAAERVPRITDEFLVMAFRTVSGDSYRHLARYGEAAAEYEAGIVIAEKALPALNDEAKRLKWVEGADPVYRGLALVLLQQGKDVDALKLWEWYGSRTQQDSHAAKTSWKEQQTQIFPLQVSLSETRLIYAVFEDRLQIWSVSANGIKGHAVKINPYELEQKVSAFARECATPPGPQSSQDDLLRTDKALGALFLEPVLAEISPGQPVVVEMDEKLSSLPLVALVRSDGRFFGQDYAVTASPGIYRENDLRRSVPVANGSPMLVVQGSSNLPGQDELVDKIVAEFSHATVLTPKHASRSEMDLKLPASEILLVISHGIHDASGTVLVLGDERIRAEDIRPTLLKRLKLAVLEACSSGASNENGPSDPANLVRAFQAAGVPNVISTRWDVDSQSTSEFMAVFFQHLGKGETAAQAMFHARNNVLRAHSHPYFWAGLDLAGRAN